MLEDKEKTTLTCSAMEGEGVRQVTAHKKNACKTYI